MSRIAVLLTVALLAACGDTDPADSFAFAGISAVSADGSSGLIASWGAAVGGEGQITYTATLESMDGPVLESASTAGTLAWFEALEPGLYRLRTAAADEAGTVLGADVSLVQLAGPNRLQYRSEVPLTGPDGQPMGGADVWGEGDTLVIAGLASAASFMVVDASDASDPQVIATAADGGYVKDVKGGDGLLFTNAEPHAHGGPGEERHGPGSDDGIAARVWDFSDPAAPSLLAEVGTPSMSAHNVSYGRGMLYLAENTSQALHAWSVASPTDPEFAWSWEPPSGFVHDMAWLDDRVVVAWWDGFTVLDVSVPTEAPVVLAEHTYSGASCHNAWLTAGGGYVLTTDEAEAGHLRIWDIRDPGDIRQAAEWMTTEDSSIHNVHIRGELAFIAYYADGVQVLDISEPTAPRLVGWYDTFAEEEDPEPPGDDDDIDPECIEGCLEICLGKCPNCEDFCDEECASICGDGGQGGGPGGDLFNGAWGVWPFGNHIAVGDMERGLVILDFYPDRVEH